MLTSCVLKEKSLIEKVDHAVISQLRDISSNKKVDVKCTPRSLTDNKNKYVHERYLLNPHPNATHVVSTGTISLLGKQTGFTLALKVAFLVNCKVGCNVKTQIADDLKRITIYAH